MKCEIGKYIQSCDECGFCKTKSKKIKVLFWSKYLVVKSLINSIKDFRKIHLMDNVIYNGKLCFINNGSRTNDKGETVWDVVEKEWNEDGTRNSYHLTSKQFKRVLSLKNIKNDLLYIHNWYINCWYRIDLNKKIGR